MKNYELDKEILEAILKTKHLSPTTALASITLDLLKEIHELKTQLNKD